MTEGRHRPPFDQAHVVAPFGPMRESAPRKFTPPAEAPNDRLQHLLDHASRTPLGADSADDDDLAAGPEKTRKLVERRLRVRYRVKHVMRHHHVKRRIRK